MGDYIKLHEAAVNHSSAGVLLALESVDANIQDEYGWSCLHRVLSVPDEFSEANTVMITRILLERGADTNLVDRRGRSALHAAAVHNKPRTGEMLIAHGGVVDSQDNTGHTPLHQAASIGNAEFAEMLLKNNADPNIHDNKKRLL